MFCTIKVLSESVSKAVELIGGVEAAETTKFLIMFDKFFDCLNVTVQRVISRENLSENLIVQLMIFD